MQNNSTIIMIYAPVRRILTLESFEAEEGGKNAAVAGQAVPHI